MHRKLVTCILAILLFLNIYQFAEAANIVEDNAILLLLDSSGSMDTEDPQRFWLDAIAASIDISPKNTYMAFVAISNTVVTSKPFVDISEQQNRESLLTAAQGVAIQGNTDFSAGLYAALELFESRSERSKHIFLIGDIGESGFFRPLGGYSEATGRLTDLTDELSDAGIHVHLVFISTPNINEQFMPLWENLAYHTDGSMTFVDQPQQLTQTIQSLYFGLFSYNKTVKTAINTAEIPKEIIIQLPDFDADRVRFHISSTEPIEGVQFHAESGYVSFSETRLHTTIALSGELPETATLVLPPNVASEMSIIMLVDGMPPELVEEEPYVPILPIEPPIAEPIEDIPPIVPAPLLTPTTIAIIIGGLLIAIALIIFFLIRKKEDNPVATEALPEGTRFYGKLSVYALTIDGGARELRPFDFPLQTLSKKAVTLCEIMNSDGLTDIFSEAHDIVFSVGAGESIIVSNNNSKAVIRMMGRNYGFQTKIQMFYGQKIYLKLNADNELEISFRAAPEPIAGLTQIKMNLRPDNHVNI